MTPRRMRGSRKRNLQTNRPPGIWLAIHSLMQHQGRRRTHLLEHQWDPDHQLQFQTGGTPSAAAFFLEGRGSAIGRERSQSVRRRPASQLLAGSQQPSCPLLRQDKCLLLRQDRCLLRCLLLRQGKCSVARADICPVSTRNVDVSEVSTIQDSDKRSGPKSTNMV